MQGIAGVAGGWIDNILMRFTDATYAFPDLLLIILFAAVFRETWIGRAWGGLFAIFLAIVTALGPEARGAAFGSAR